MFRDKRSVINVCFGIAVVVFSALSLAHAQSADAEKIFRHFRENILTTSHEDCVKDLTRAIKLDAKNPDYFYYRGWCYMLEKDSANAIADLNETLSLNPTYIKALYDRSYVLSWSDKEKAIPDLKRIVEIAPNEINAYALLAGYYIGLGRYDDAYAMGAKIVELVPSAGTGYRYQADALSRQGKYDDAIKLYSEAIRKTDWDVQAYRGRAAAYRSLGDNAAAAVDEQTVKTLNQTTGGGMGAGSGTGKLSDPMPSTPASSDQTDTATVEPMTFIRRPPPSYTTEARKQNIQGQVTLRVTFKSDGTIGQIAVIRGLTFGLTEKAIEAAKAIEFKPATRNGVPVTTAKLVVYTFNLY